MDGTLILKEDWHNCSGKSLHGWLVFYEMRKHTYRMDEE